jgi:hypothetical protein
MPNLTGKKYQNVVQEEWALRAEGRIIPGGAVMSGAKWPGKNDEGDKIRW